MNQQLDIFLNLKEPQTHTQEVLFALINDREVSIEKFRGLPGFRTRVSELSRQHNLSFKDEVITKLNKFGNRFTYVNHILPENQFEKAIEVYKRITR